MTLGEKIKKARIESKMTQSELADGKITRNMLCQIELGTAKPSIDTIYFLAEKLSIPIPYLFSENDDMLFYKKKEFLAEIYEKYRSKDYLSCVQMLEDLHDTDDELSFIKANAYFHLAKSSLFSGALKSCAKYIDLAEKNCNLTSLDTAHIKTLLPMYRAIASNIQAPLLEFDQTNYDLGLCEVFDFELYKYLIQDHEYNFTNESIISHVQAKHLIKERKYTEAISILNDAAEKGLVSYNAFIMFGIYTDLEYCYKQIYDFENAYRFSTKRLSMLEGFKS